MIEKWLQYTCDGCGETETDGDPNVSAREVRERLRGYGWRNVGRLDYCAGCVESGACARRESDFSA